jgi:AcrR family transcriptional regulator
MGAVRSETARDAILAAAHRTLVDDPGASIATVTAEAGVSRATFYRHFDSRAELLAALDIEPDPGAHQRILAAAAELVARDGIARLSMDELAALAGVSRASVYRLFPGKSALFAELISTYAPFAPMLAALDRLRDRGPDEVLPEIVRVAARAAGPQVGIIRSLMFEVTSGSPEAVAGAREAFGPVFSAVSAYLAGQMTAGSIRPMHPLLAAQALMGPLVFHLVTRSFAVPHAGLDLGPDEAAAEFARVALGGLLAEGAPA